MKDAIIAIVVVLVLGLGGWYVSTLGNNSQVKDGNSADKAVAVVNGENITQGEYDTLQTQIATGQGIDTASTTDEIKAELKKQTLDALISQKLIKQVVSKSGITASSTAVDAQVKAIRGQFETEDAFMAALQAQNMTEESLRTQISSDLATEAYLDQELHLSSLTVTDAEIETAYNKLAEGQEGVPALKDVKDQVKGLLLQQKQQALVTPYLEELRSKADVKVLI